jgi:N-acyl-phosphatidylethanolamine-hydrolysing phospholipase D
MISRSLRLVGVGNARRFARSYISVDELAFTGDSVPVATGATATAVMKTPRSHKVAGRFISPWTAKTNKPLFSVLKYLSQPKRPPLTFSKEVDRLLILKPIEVNRTKIRSIISPHITWMGHASCYFQSDGLYFLTDPVWSERASPVSFAGPKRYINPPIELEDLKIDVVLVSHTHYDHLDLPSVRRIGNRAHWVVPMGVKEILRKEGVTNCTELEWWESYHHVNARGSTAEIIFTPTKHWTSRTPFDRNSCLWGSYIVKANSSKFFFTGDTAYCETFKLIGENYGPFDFAAIPIGAYSPRWFMKHVHCNPEEAVMIHEDLRSKQSIAIHWGTFPMTDEDKIEPPLELARVRDMRSIPSRSFFSMAHGETLIAGDAPKFDLATLHPDLYGEYLSLRREAVDVEPAAT